MKTETGLYIIHKKINGVSRVEAYTKKELENKNLFNAWWNQVKKHFKYER